MMAGVNGKSGKFKNTHGLSRHAGYRTWYNLVSRCTDPRHIHYKYYGGRGITVCEDWKNGPEKFLSWLELSGWKQGLQVDRKDNDAGYCPKNCRIVSKKQNGANKRNNKMIDVRGQMMHVAGAARFLGIPIATLYARVRKGFEGEKLIAPSRPKRLGKSVSKNAS